MFRGRIGAQKRRCETPADAGNVDDPAWRASEAFIHAQQRREGLAGSQQAKNIDFKMRLKLINWLHGQRPHIRDPGIVDETVQGLSI